MRGKKDKEKEKASELLSYLDSAAFYFLYDKFSADGEMNPES